MEAFNNIYSRTLFVDCIIYYLRFPLVHHLIVCAFAITKWIECVSVKQVTNATPPIDASR